MRYDLSFDSRLSVVLTTVIVIITARRIVYMHLHLINLTSGFGHDTSIMAVLSGHLKSKMSRFLCSSTELDLHISRKAVIYIRNIYQMSKKSDYCYCPYPFYMLE